MDFLDLLLGHQQRAGIVTGFLGETAQHFAKLTGIRAECFHIALGAAKTRSGHHVHRLGDLLGLFDALDFKLYVFECRHMVLSSLLPDWVE